MEELRKNLIELCNQSGLPLEAILFVVKDVYRDAEESFRQYKASLETQKTEEKDKEEQK